MTGRTVAHPSIQPGAIALRALALAVLLGGSSCSSARVTGNVVPGPVVGSIGSRSGGVRAVRALPRRARPPMLARPAARSATLRRVEEKVHPGLQAFLQPDSQARQIRVIVSFRDTSHIPVLPEEVVSRDRTIPSRTPAFTGVQTKSETLLNQWKQSRRADFDSLQRDLEQTHRASASTPLWITRAIAMDVASSEIPALAARSDVIYLEPALDGSPPPQSDSSAARANTGADPLIAGGHGKGLVALLDTGVLATHKLLQGTGNIRYRGDCVNGDAACGGASAAPGEACPGSDGHGTGSAGILTGNSSLGDNYRGMTDVKVDSYRIYASKEVKGICGAELDAKAAAEAVYVAIAKGARVMLIESQGVGSSYSVISQAANVAFEAGVVVLAPVGNWGEGKLGCPGRAHRVLAVGAWDLDSGDWYADQSYGTTEFDGRIKPEIVAPTGCMTASGRNVDALTELSQTSGAAPVATGVAVLLRNLLRGGASAIAPGQVYSAMIACTDTTERGYTIVKHGAGRLVVPKEAEFWGESVDLEDGDIAEFELDVSGARTLRVGVWWPDPIAFEAGGFPESEHSDVNLEIVKVTKRGETVVAESSRGDGVFERAEARITGSADTRWVVRLTGYDIASGPQRVYWTAVAKP